MIGKNTQSKKEIEKFFLGGNMPRLISPNALREITDRVWSKGYIQGKQDAYREYMNGDNPTKGKS